MANIFIRVSHVTVALTAFVWLARNEEFAACPALSLVHKRTSYFQLASYEWRNRSGSENVCRSPHSGFEPLLLHTTNSSCSCYMSGHMCVSRRDDPLAARFIHIPFGHGCCQVPYHAIMPGNLIVQQVQSFGCFGMPFEHNFFTIQPGIHNDLILPKMVLKTLEFGDSPTVVKAETSRRN